MQRLRFHKIPGEGCQLLGFVLESKDKKLVFSNNVKKGKNRKKGKMTDIKEALFDEEPEKREGSGEKDPDMEPLFGQGRDRKERRVGKECSLPCRSRWSPYH